MKGYVHNQVLQSRRYGVPSPAKARLTVEAYLAHSPGQERWREKQHIRYARLRHRREGRPLSWAPSADAVAGGGRRKALCPRPSSLLQLRDHLAAEEFERTHGVRVGKRPGLGFQ